MKTYALYFLVAGVVLAGSALVNNAWAYKLIPLSAEMSPYGKGARQVFRVENPSEEPIAIEFSISARDMTPDGKDVLSDAEDDFVLYPAQAIVMPGKSQAIRIQWIGDPKPEKELAYRLIVEQLPVSFDEGPSDGGQLKLLVRFIASIYIVPNAARSNVGVESATAQVDESGAPLLRLDLANTGNAHQLLRDPSLTLTVGSTSIHLGPEQLPMLASQNILAGHAREFVLPWPADLPAGTVEAALSYRGQ